MPAERHELLHAALSQGWYHTIDLAPGATTSGTVDLRALAPKVLPARLDGRRALDVGTFDGFWAFELEKRGAEVVATDLARFDEVEWPPQNRERLEAEAGARGPGDRFGLAAQLLGSRVERIEANVYDLEPGLLGGPVDYAVVGDLLLHLRDPVGALERVRSVLSDGGRLLSLEQINVPLTVLRPRRAAAAFHAAATSMSWWEPNIRALLDALRVSGFAGARIRRVYRLRAAGPQARWHVAIEARA